MGGKALKTVETRRLGRSDYERVAAKVAATLREAFSQSRVEVIPAYRSKADFGDLDVLVSQPAQPLDGNAVTLLAQQEFHAREFYRNGNVLSFDYHDSERTDEPGFQVDVITMPEESFDFALRYFSFNDLGNLIGRTAHKQGCSFGHDGLWFYVRDTRECAPMDAHPRVLYHGHPS